MNIKLSPNKWITKVIPLLLIKHRLLVTDPTYKFSINAVIHGRSNIGIRRDSDDNDYYDIPNMSVPQDTAISPEHWLTYINQNFNLNLILGDEFQSTVFPELFFVSEIARETFDTVYNTIQNDFSFSSEGINLIVDFNIKLSGGFIRNKLGINTDNVKNWILDGISFSILKLIMEQDSLSNFKIKDNYKLVYDLNKDDIEIIESLFYKYSSLYPKLEDLNIFWYYLDRYVGLSSPESRSSLFNFQFNGAIVKEVNTKDVSFALNSYNRPMYIQTQSKFDPEKEVVYVTISGPNIPISIEQNSIAKRDIEVQPNKNIKTKINNHIYMVNKK